MNNGKQNLKTPIMRIVSDKKKILVLSIFKQRAENVIFMKKIFTSTRIVPLAIMALLAIGFGCQKDEDTVVLESRPSDYSYEIPQSWNNVMVSVERYTAGYRPPIAARSLGYINLAAFESVQPGMDDVYNSFDGYYPGLDIPEIETGLEYHWGLVLNATYARAASLFYPTAPAAQLFEIFKQEDKINDKYRAQVPNEVFVRSVEYGRRVADAVYKWSATDAVSHEAYLRNNDPSYVPPTGYGKWQPTYPDFARPLLPNWGKSRTFAANQTDVCPEPLAISSSPASEVFKQAEAVQRIVGQIKAGNRYEDRWIADFWSDDCPILTFTPPSHWIAIASQVIETSKARLPLALETYARVGLAINDAGVRAWAEKYRYNVERPIDYIRREMGDANWNTLMCPDGSGEYFTPPFPAYPSGHATFGAAAAEVLTELYGNFPFTDRCHEGRTEFVGTPRKFTNFYEAAEENAYSRVPIGVHFEMDATAGLDLGYAIGKKVNKLPWRK